jgi:hypothetical protein
VVGNLNLVKPTGRVEKCSWVKLNGKKKRVDKSSKLE